MVYNANIDNLANIIKSKNASEVFNNNTVLKLIQKLVYESPTVLSTQTPRKLKGMMHCGINPFNGVYQCYYL